MKHSDFLYRNNRRFYRYSCDSCNSDMGYMRPYNATLVQHSCRSCNAIPNPSPSNVDTKDYQDKHNARYYRTSCISCGDFRGYLPIAKHAIKCRRCTKNKNLDILEKDGVSANDFVIKKDNRKKYRMTCLDCGADRGYQRLYRYGSGLCKSCASIKFNSGKTVSEESRKRMSENNWIKKLAKEDHPFFGKYHSDETKKRIAEKQKEYCKNKGNQFNLGKSKGRHRWTTIQKLSEANSGREPKWKGRVFLYDGPIGRFKLRSSYELAYANWLDSKGISWKYEPNFRLSDGRSFSPDFQLSTGEIIEIKGFWTDKAKVKWEMFCLEFPDLKKTVLMKEDLQKIGLNV